VLVAGVLPFLGGVEEAESGKLAPRDAGVERDLRAAAGLIAETEADLLLVDGGPSVAGARAAADVAVETGLAVWMSVPVSGGPVPRLTSGETVEAWATSMIHAGVTGFLLMPTNGTDVPGALERLRAAGVPAEQTGVLPVGDHVARVPTRASEPQPSRADRATDRGAGDADEPAGSPLGIAATRWLEGGAWHLGIGDGATPDRLAALRSAMDAVDGAWLVARAAARERWAALVGEAARRAPGGRAAWIGDRDPDVPLPAGFAWTVVPVAAADALPAGELRLVIAAGSFSVDRLATLLEPGGILLARETDPLAVSTAGLRLLDVVERPPAILARRDP
jgi:hypothetical protein